MKRRCLAGLAPALFLFVLASPASAQKPASTAPAKAAPAATPVPAAQAAAVQELFKAVQMQEEVQDMPDAMIASEVSRNPGLEPFRDVMVKWLKKYMTWQAMAPELTKLYAANFTEAELKAMVAFYKTPAGQKALLKMPELTQRSAMIGAQLGQAHSDELKGLMTARSAELEKKQKAAAGAAPQPGAGKPPAAKPAAPTKKP
ncbi:MAG: DUF2059 domain-containing protein [Thermoanaerobaculia bacterium]